MKDRYLSKEDTQMTNKHIHNSHCYQYEDEEPQRKSQE